MTTPIRQFLEQVRKALLDLHKTLVDSERVTYEQAIGPIKTTNHFLQLLTSDPWFAWLHPISQLIVAMDEVLDSKKPVEDSTAEELIVRAKTLLIASEIGEGFSKHYYEALQRDPDVVLSHAEVAKHFVPKKSQG